MNIAKMRGLIGGNWETSSHLFKKIKSQLYATEVGVRREQIWRRFDDDDDDGWAVRAQLASFYYERINKQPIRQQKCIVLVHLVQIE